ncbi:MAG: kynurenine 3-monooxygenase [Gammaproteobacteria bacterium]|nr:MAG: kynurenine 3-monooxygenase [Gammaproteobacteria bacterium]
MFSMNNTHLTKITLAGGGLVGSLLALVLAKKGYQVDVFESRPDLRKVDISAGKSINLALANRGIKPLNDLGLMSDIKKMLIPMCGRMVHIDGQTANLQPYGQQKHEVIYSISRGELNGYLITQAELTGKVNFYFEHKLTDVNFDHNQLTLIHKGEELTHHFDHLIGTDGANSQVRKAILAQSEALANYQHDEQLLNHSYKELVIKANANGKHKIDKNALHIWPRGNFMIIALPNLDGSFTVTLFLPANGLATQKETKGSDNKNISFSQLLNTDQINAFFDENFNDLKPLIDNLEDDFLTNPIGRLATIKCAPWSYQDKALILGDAAHAVVPFHGQGMNCGFEDCDLINQLLPDADNLADNLSKNFDWQQFFQTVETERKVNSDAIADMAIENYIEMRNSVMQADYLLKKQCAFKIQQWFPRRFTPRYAMVMFEHRPYREAFELGEIHQQMLNELCENIDNVEQLTKATVEQLLAKYEL